MIARNAVPSFRDQWRIACRIRQDSTRFSPLVFGRNNTECMDSRDTLAFVERIVVTMPKKKRGQKSDITDAIGLAEQLRRGAIDVNIYKNQGSFGKLRQLVKTQSALSADLTRVQNRIKALFLPRGIPTSGKDVYNKVQRDLWLAQLPKTIRNSAGVVQEEHRRERFQHVTFDTTQSASLPKSHF